jgi:hypothetical protein
MKLGKLKANENLMFILKISSKVMRNLSTTKENKKKKEKEKIKEITRKKKVKTKNLIGMKIMRRGKRSINKNKM